MTAIPFSSAFRGGAGGSRHNLKTAAGMFAKKGYYQTTVDDMARALGVAKGTIYYHFKNKEELYLAIIQEGISLFEKQIRLDMSGSKTPAGKIKKIISGMLVFVEEEKDLVFLFIKELCGTDLQREALAKMLSVSIGMIRGVIEEGVKTGDFKNLDPEMTTSTLFGMIIIPALHFISYTKKIPHDQVNAVVEVLFFKGILNPDTGEGL